jgi:hypothetical protein
MKRHRAQRATWSGPFERSAIPQAASWCSATSATELIEHDAQRAGSLALASDAADQAIRCSAPARLHAALLPTAASAQTAASVLAD